MKILVVSGFLGAGKTTFIRELIRRTGKKPVILENEYGENDLDRRSLQGSGGLEILEFMEGCVCCTKKDAFLNTILTISSAMDPEYLVVEPTGIGRLGNILSEIRKIEYERIRLLGPVLILAPRSLHAYLHEYPEICADQLANAHTILFSKAEQESADFLADTVQQVRRFNPAAEILTTHYTGQDDDWFQKFFLREGEDTAVPAASASGDETPLDQLTLSSASVTAPCELVVFLEDLLRGVFGNIPRAKGVLKAGGEWLRFDVADGLYAVTGTAEHAPKTQCTFIGPSIERDRIRKRLHEIRKPGKMVYGAPSRSDQKPGR